MKIERNGIEYKLTADELWAAYGEQQHINDIANIEINLDDTLSDEQIKKVENNSNFFDEAAYALRSNLDNLGIDFDLAVSKAIENTFDDFEIRTRIMNRIFYSIEQWNSGKMVHVFGEIYQLGNGEEKDYRSAQFTRAYLEIEDIQESGGKFMEYIYNDGNQIYESNMTETDAEECCKSYFSGKPGTELNIYKCDEDTPCGDYWCEI